MYILTSRLPMSNGAHLLISVDETPSIRPSTSEWGNENISSFMFKDVSAAIRELDPDSTMFESVLQDTTQSTCAHSSATTRGNSTSAPGLFKLFQQSFPFVPRLCTQRLIQPDVVTEIWPRCRFEDLCLPSYRYIMQVTALECVN